MNPLHAIAGGALIGAAASLLLLGTGRVAGISGIVSGVLPGGTERGWRLTFLLGLAAGAALMMATGIGAVPVVETPAAWLVPAGLLVGVGTRLGSGCTSGHGVCGVSSGSLRSVAATATFMAAGALTVFCVRHVIGGIAG